MSWERIDSRTYKSGRYVAKWNDTTSRFDITDVFTNEPQPSAWELLDPIVYPSGQLSQHQHEQADVVGLEARLATLQSDLEAINTNIYQVPIAAELVVALEHVENYTSSRVVHYGSDGLLYLNWKGGTQWYISQLDPVAMRHLNRIAISEPTVNGFHVESGNLFVFGAGSVFRIDTTTFSAIEPIAATWGGYHIPASDPGNVWMRLWNGVDTWYVYRYYTATNTFNAYPISPIYPGSAIGDDTHIYIQDHTTATLHRFTIQGFAGAGTCTVGGNARHLIDSTGTGYVYSVSDSPGSIERVSKADLSVTTLSLSGVRASGILSLDGASIWVVSLIQDWIKEVDLSSFSAVRTITYDATEKSWFAGADPDTLLVDDRGTVWVFGSASLFRVDSYGERYFRTGHNPYGQSATIGGGFLYYTNSTDGVLVRRAAI